MLFIVYTTLEEALNLFSLIIKTKFDHIIYHSNKDIFKRKGGILKMMPGLEVEAENRGEPAQCYGDMKQ